MSILPVSWLLAIDMLPPCGVMLAPGARGRRCWAVALSTPAFLLAYRHRRLKLPHVAGAMALWAADPK